MSAADQVVWISFVQYVWLQREAGARGGGCVCVCVRVCVCARVCVNAEWHKEPVTWEDPPDSTFTRVLCFPGVAQDPVYLPYAVTRP